MKVTIPRKKWGKNYLWDEKKDCGCVMGHILLAQGVKKKELKGFKSPTEVPTIKDYPFVENGQETDLARDLFILNDCSEEIVSCENKERLLAEKLSPYQIELVFID